MNSLLDPTRAKEELARREIDRRKARTDPLWLVGQMKGVDQRTGEKFDFTHVAEPLPEGAISIEEAHVTYLEKDWRWQRFLAERVLEDRRLIILKGRQLGATWVVLAIDVAEAIQMPDTVSLIYRQKEDEAIDNVRRWWRLYQSLPKHLTAHIKVLKPDPGKASQPGRDGVVLQFPGGELSEIVPMTSAGSSGHGRSVRRIILDEGAYIEELEAIMAAVEPAAGPASINIISTANGRHNPETGEGNEYSRRWTDADLGHSGYVPIFFPYDIHPDRGPDWHLHAEEYRSLKPHQRAAQFPRNKHEAFMLTSRTFFEPEDLMAYRELVRAPIRKLQFRAKTPTQSLISEGDGPIKVFQEPQGGHKYAIGADVATGRGADYSAAYVIDLATMGLVAEVHAKLDADLFAFQLHYLGKWYNTAKLAVEIGGGYGDAVIASLRDGREGRPPYPNIYVHTQSGSTRQQPARRWGFPTNLQTRPLILNQLEKAVREKTLPFVTDSLLWEMEVFVYHDAGTSPRALDGSRDDLVMAMAITLEMYRLYGEHADDRRKSFKRFRRRQKPLYPWQGED